MKTLAFWQKIVDNKISKARNLETIFYIHFFTKKLITEINFKEKNMILVNIAKLFRSWTCGHIPRNPQTYFWNTLYKVPHLYLILKNSFWHKKIRTILSILIIYDTSIVSLGKISMWASKTNTFHHIPRLL